MRRNQNGSHLKKQQEPQLECEVEALAVLDRVEPLTYCGSPFLVSLLKWTQASEQPPSTRIKISWRLWLSTSGKMPNVERVSYSLSMSDVFVIGGGLAGLAAS